MLDNLWSGLITVFQWQNILAMLAGVTAGQLVGAIPGFTVTMTIAILLPVTYYLDPVFSILLLLGIYKGGVYGGSIPAILLNAPGTPAASATMLDGHPMAKKGQAQKALKMALYASVSADTISDIVLILVAGALAAVAMKFGPPEFFALVLFSLTIIGGLTGKSVLKGMLSTCLGLFIAVVGLDPTTAIPRFTLGSFEIESGFALVPTMIGLFVMSEIFEQVEAGVAKGSLSIFKDSLKPEDNRISKEEWKRSIPAILQSTAIGTFIGAIPGLGPAISTFIGYGQAQRISKHPEKFGTGVVEGVAAAEAGNSSACGATLIPLLSLGIPGDVATAVLVGAFMLHGLRPGPMLFEQHTDFVYAILVGQLVCNLANLLVAQGTMRAYSKIVTSIPRLYLYPIVWALCIIGSYAINASMFDVYCVLFFGLIGYGFRKTDMPLIPMLIAFILSPMLEVKLRQTLIISDGNLSVFYTKPLALVFMIATFLMVGYLVYSRLRRNKSKKTG
jgi:putative tricarboxylic transport membrane protein